ncbi:hypothetical protein TSUD_184710 [Trifolium subterraneum]|uniref:Subtilisin-like protease fibronectin type-III domain-containing protein n=1 Tax=Trifolium subterraneum TaxID=3900 RepID=A0A2Z6P6Y1_TRISU|nr:hypothetical protein TSUD_184710 [Trifolium subterraneum]
MICLDLTSEGTESNLQIFTINYVDLMSVFIISTEKAKESIFYSYNKNINGFAAILDEDEAAEIASVWPESKSFSDEGYGPVPKKWRGICQVAKGNQDKFYCNRKLIGARYFHKGYESSPHDEEKNETFTFNSARDTDGHGTHTLSTAGGNFVVGANVFGYGNGTASGGSPKARVASYKVCWGSCYEADILAGFEHAISDGVDVLSVSLGGPPQEYSKNSLSIGSFHAVANNIVVVASGGNSGPSPFTVSNLEPWVLTVAASTIDRSFASYVILGNKQVLKGESLSELYLPAHKSYPLISAADAAVDGVSSVDALLCKEGALDPQKVKGKILVCLRGDNSRVEKGMQASKVGAIGMILANDESSGGEVIADPHVLPATHVNFTEGNYILNYINNTKSPVAYITRVKTQLGVSRNPSMASFSSRGPNTLVPTLLKPDITAPGVNVIASYSEFSSPSENESDKRRTPFITMSGTSMSCPHVAGLVGLLKSLHPNWSPAAIKSAIMTTATTKDNTGEHLLDSLGKATPFAYGAGHVRPNLAADPGLVYDLNITDHLNFLCGHGYNSDQLKPFYGKPYTCPKSFNLLDFNYPTITIPQFKIGQSLTVTRTVTNVGSPSKYRVRIEAPSELLVSVEPKKLLFKEKGEKKDFKVTFTLKQQSKYKTDYIFGKLIWTNGRHRVGTPIVIKYPQ